MSARDGGPAFPDGNNHSTSFSMRDDRGEPLLANTVYRATTAQNQPGMSLRQFYKAHAQSLCAAVIFADPRGGAPDPAQLAKLCADFADAQLAEDAEFAAKGGTP